MHPDRSVRARRAASALAALALTAVPSASAAAAPAEAAPPVAPAPAQARAQAPAQVPAQAQARALGAVRAAAGVPPERSRVTYGTAVPRCTITDVRAAGVSGLALAGRTLYGASDQPPVRLLAFDSGCRVSAAYHLSVPRPIDATAALPAGDTDVEDLAAGPDGAVWLADTGGNRAPRRGVSLYRWPGKGTAVVRYDLRYPDGPHDAEALLVSLLGDVLIVTKTDRGGAGVYAAPRPLRSTGDLTKVAELKLAALRPAGQTGAASLLVTGGAVAPDGVHVALRTYTAAYEWDAPDGDLVRALRGRPRVVALHDKAGEAIVYSPGGRSLLTAGEGVPGALSELPIVRVALPPTGSAPILDPVTLAGSFATIVLCALVFALGRERRRWASRATTYQAG